MFFYSSIFSQFGILGLFIFCIVWVHTRGSIYNSVQSSIQFNSVIDDAIQFLNKRTREPPSALRAAGAGWQRCLYIELNRGNELNQLKYINKYIQKCKKYVYVKLLSKQNKSVIKRCFVYCSFVLKISKLFCYLFRFSQFWIFGLFLYFPLFGFTRGGQFIIQFNLRFNSIRGLTMQFNSTPSERESRLRPSAPAGVGWWRSLY